MSKILIVEDDSNLRELYKDTFNRQGFETHATPYGEEGLTLMRELRPDIVLLDLILPDITGFSVLENANHDPSINTIPIIVMTNLYADGEDLVKNHGVKSFLAKSDIMPNQIVEKVNALLGLSPAPAPTSTDGTGTPPATS
jgi:DNA-binding response OmpR family regulator